MFGMEFASREIPYFSASVPIVQYRARPCEPDMKRKNPVFGPFFAYNSNKLELFGRFFPKNGENRGKTGPTRSRQIRLS